MVTHTDQVWTDVRVATLREAIIESLLAQGFCWTEGQSRLSIPHHFTKDKIRELHRYAINTIRARARRTMAPKEPMLLTHIANGDEINPSRIAPKLIEVCPRTKEELLFRYAKLYWSIPVSAGYGRRLRFLVMDNFNKKLIGLIGLGDPVFSIKARDHWIGWNHDQKKKRLRHVMDAFVLGAVPPYSYLLCGKLVALLATSSEVCIRFHAKYKNSQSVITGREFDGSLAAITTTSALGRSSMYNRLRFQGRDVYMKLGETAGSGEFQFANGLYTELSEFAKAHIQPTAKKETWGIGWRNRRELVRYALPKLGLSRDLLYHSISRHSYISPLASNTREFLLGQCDTLAPRTNTLSDWFSYFRDRWLIPRASRDKTYQEFRAESIALWTGSTPTSNE